MGTEELGHLRTACLQVRGIQAVTRRVLVWLGTAVVKWSSEARSRWARQVAAAEPEAVNRRRPAGFVQPRGEARAGDWRRRRLRAPAKAGGDEESASRASSSGNWDPDRSMSVAIALSSGAKVQVKQVERSATEFAALRRAYEPRVKTQSGVGLSKTLRTAHFI